jgi:hypothetical protein
MLLQTLWIETRHMLLLTREPFVAETKRKIIDEKKEPIGLSA